MLKLHLSGPAVRWKTVPRSCWGAVFGSGDINSSGDSRNRRERQVLTMRPDLPGAKSKCGYLAITL